MHDRHDPATNQEKNPPVLLFRAIFGVLLGGLAGFALYRYVGCPNGTCLIASSPWGSVVSCMILGFVVSQVRWPHRGSKHADS
jgi:F0F1-type ATP synthase assembly protein I